MMLLDMATDTTTTVLRRAVQGDEPSLGWVVERFSPILLAQADWRLGARLRAFYDPGDIVSEAWLIALPRFRDLQTREGRLTPVLVRFLSTTVVHIINGLARKHLRRGDALPLPTTNVPERATVTSVVVRMMSSEATQELKRALASLSPSDLEILMLRGIEQRQNQVVATLLGISTAAASARYMRALERVRMHFPEDFIMDD